MTALIDHYMYGMVEMCESIVRAANGDVVRNETFAAFDAKVPAAFFNSAFYFSPLTRAEDAKPIEEFFDGNGRGDALLWSANVTADLSGRGWTIEGFPPFMASAPLERPDAPAGVDVKRIDTFEELKTWISFWTRSFPFEDCELDQTLSESLLDDDRLHIWLASVDGEPVATSLALPSETVNSVELVVTAPQARGKGIGAYMTLLAATARPGLPAALLASDLGRLLYERLGFRAITRATLWKRSRGPAKA